MGKKKVQAEDAKGGPAEQAPAVPPRLRERYFKELLPALGQKLGRDNLHSLPRVQKVVINMGVGSAISEKKHMEDALAALTQIAGQKAAVTRSRKSIANFKLREGQEIGCKVTLRGTRMYEFLDRLISLALPRVRDFRGLNPDAFDGQGNYSLGLSEQLVFPELNPDKFTRPQGMNVTIVISGTSNDDSRELLRGLGLPFKVPEPAGPGKG
ncbi:MAG TPA: 50S ribosomal protein L5 [Pirellulales bacterium]